MFKKITITIIIIVSLTLLILSSSTVSSFLIDSFWGMLAEEFVIEENQRLEDISNGKLVPGKDTVLIWNNLYEIAHLTDGNHLSMKEEVNMSEPILEKIIKYKKYNDKLYIYAEEGFAVINQDNICEVYISIDEEKYISGYTLDSSGNKKYISRRIDSKYVKYLESYNDFDANDLIVLNSLK